MRYKALLLAVLLVPITFAYSRGSEAEIKKQQASLYKKELELSKIGQKIANKYELIDKIKQRIQNLMLEKADGKNSAEQEILIKTKLMENSNTCFFKELFNVLSQKKSIEEFFIKEFLSQDDDASGSCGEFKFLLLRWINEERLMKPLVKKYGKLLKGVNEIDQKIIELQQ